MSTEEINQMSEINKERKALPVFRVRKILVKRIKENKCTIIIGETACGKTTQIPQYLYQAGVMGDHTIGITQPRRVAAITIARRVALERNTLIGDIVGYSVRFDEKSSPNTKIKYMTDGMLLRESILDPLLLRYSIIIIDEAHERTLNTDVLFGVVKLAQTVREEKGMVPLKIIIMSATMDVDHFSEYFNKCPAYFVKGRQYPIKVFYTKKLQEDYEHAALVTVFQIHQNEPEGDILVFCTGQEEIESMVKIVRNTALQLPSDCMKICAYPLYSALQTEKQMKVFQKPVKGTRKVVFATNIAETSITIPGIKYVVDTGMVKVKTFNPAHGLDHLKVQRISKAQSWQRCGRAGRQSNGFCYRLYTKEEYEAMAEHTVPEIQRSNLANVILQLLTIGVLNVLEFDFLSKPSKEMMLNAFKQLYLLGGIEDQEKPKLNDIGKKMSVFPLEPRYAKILIVSKDLRCTEEILSVISMLCVESVLDTQSGEKEIVKEIHEKFRSTQGDHIMMLNILRAYKKVKKSKRKEWCQENRLSQRHLKTAVAIRKQLSHLCVKAGIPLISAGQNTDVVRKCLTAGLFMNAAEFYEGKVLTIDKKQEVLIHPLSCLYRSKSSFVIYTELVETSKCYIRNVSSVRPEWLVKANPSFYQNKRLLNT